MMKVFAVLSLFLLLVSCQDDTDIEKQYTYLELEIPENFPSPVYNIENNQPTQEGFDLGKKLFYDGRLSSTGVISCGFCHIQEFSFTHHTHIVSHGVNGALGTRNAQGLQNLIFMKEFNWDGSVPHLDAQPIVPITTDVEMNETISNVLEKLKADPSYVEDFEKAFDNGKIDTENMLKALSQFMMMMVSADTKYDRVMRNEGSTFTAEEQQGKTLFDSKCASCHAGVLFTDQSYRNNGLPIDPQYNDIGRKRVTGQDTDKYKFKVPSLRNIAITFPYMHDGRFATLKDVMDHYDNGMANTENLDPQFINGTQLGIPLSEDEKNAIIAFLKTLTDDNFLLDNRFSEF
jgi:cytochrome c peroxidase